MNTDIYILQLFPKEINIDIYTYLYLKLKSVYLKWLKEKTQSFIFFLI